jgi:hypothetical protein
VNLRALAVLFALWTGATLVAAADGTALLVSTDPFGAQVFVDGAAADGVSPLVLRNLAPGTHRVEVRRQGYEQATMQVTLPPQPARNAVVAAVRLVPLFFVASFPENAEVHVGAGEATDPYLRLPAGEYTVRRSTDALHVEPIYAGERWIDGLDTALPAAIGLSGCLALYETIGPGAADRRVSPLTLSSYALTAVIIAVDLRLRTERDRVRARFRYESSDRTPREAVEQMKRADRLVQAGLLDQAVEAYQGVVTLFPDQPVAAEALFRSGRVHRVARQDAAAEGDFRRIVGRYPTPELHDRARLALAELRAAAGDTPGALEHLDALLFAGGGVSEADAAALREQLAAPSQPAAPPAAPSAPAPVTPAPQAPGSASGSP